MNKSTQQLTDTVFANSATLDAVLGCFELNAATLFDDVFGPSDESRATRAAATPQSTRSNRENQKRRIPWLGL